MNSRQLVASALKGEAVPRIPVGPLAVHFCARVTGCNLRDYTTDPRVLAESVIRYWERFRPDAVWVSADTWVSAEAMGAKVGATSPDQPFGGLGQPLVRSAADIDRIPAPDVALQGRYPLMIEALSRVVAELGRDVFVVACFDQYPFSLAAALMGLNELMLKLVDDPPFVEALMHRCGEYTTAYARALDAAGADMLSGGDSPAGLIGPALYARHALPHERRVIANLKATSSRPVSLHICGNATPLLGLMRSSEADVLEIDYQVDLPNACHIVGPDTALWGNLDPVRLLSRGSPEQITTEVRDLCDRARKNNCSRFVLSSGCTLTVETPYAHLDALVQAAKARPAHRVLMDCFKIPNDYFIT
jgi:MtaA/CmuA family methyltransferase